MLRSIGIAVALFGIVPSTGSAQHNLPAPPKYPPGVVDVTPEPVQAPSPQGRIELAPCPEPLPTFLVSVEYLLVRPRRSDLDYAAFDPRNNLIPEGKSAHLEWETRSGVRLGFIWRPRGGPNDVSFTYTYVYSSDSGSVAAPAGGILFPALTRPGIIDEALTADAFSSINYNVFDIDVGRSIVFDDCFQSRVFTGVRLADIGQVLQASYDGRDANQAMARHQVLMDGGGLTAGGEARWAFSNQFSAYGRGRGSLLVADYRVSARETDFAGNILISDVNDCFMKVVPVLDLGIGLTWRRRNWHASLGYEITQWFSQTESITFLDDFSEGKRGRRTSDLSFEAITFQIGLEF